MLDVGLVGFGFAGKVFHAPVIRAVAGLRLAAIVQRSGGSDFVHSVAELLTRPVDLVVIATPNASHYPIAKQCLLAGRDRKSTRLNSSHVKISYAVFCLK